MDSERLLDVLGQTAVVAASHKGKLENARHGDYRRVRAAADARDFVILVRTRELASQCRV